MRSALIIGAGGQDGRLLAQWLSNRDYAVRGWVRREPCAPLLCAYSIIDLLQPGVVDAQLKALTPNEIYYLAAYHHSTEDLAGENTAQLLKLSFDVHAGGLLNILQAMKTSCPQARLFYAASSHVFGNSTTEWQDENTPLRPNSAYAISKTAGLRCCQLFRKQEGIFAATGILFNHESALRKSSFVSQKIVRGALQAQRDPTFRLRLGDLDARVDWGYAPDYVEAMFRILQLPEPGDFVIASGELHSVREFAEVAFDELGLDWRQHVETDAGLLKRKLPPMRGDFSKLRSATGWGPSVNFTELVAKLVHEVGEACRTV
jgi:GDPmannose 4,6-dehydratase